MRRAGLYERGSRTSPREGNGTSRLLLGLAFRVDARLVLGSTREQVGGQSVLEIWAER